MSLDGRVARVLAHYIGNTEQLESARWRGTVGRPTRAQAEISRLKSQQMLDLHLSGATIRQIADIFGLSRSTCWERMQWARRERREGAWTCEI